MNDSSHSQYQTLIPYYRSKLDLLSSLVPVKMGISSYHSNGQRPLGPDSTVPKKECERIIQTLLQKVSYKHPKLEHRSDLKPKLENNLHALGLGDDLIQRHNGASISTTLCIFRPNNSDDVRHRRTYLSFDDNQLFY